MDWQELSGTKEFFRQLRADFVSCLYDGWYATTDPMLVQRYRGQRDVFEAIERILGERREE